MNAATSGAFVASESYLYIREMIVESLTHLSENSVICVALMVYVVGVGALVRIMEPESEPT